MKLLRFVPVLALGLIGISAPAGAAVSPHWHWHWHHHGGAPYNCTGGDIPAGNYGSVVISGDCYATIGTIVVRNDLTVEPGALFDDITAGDGLANTLPAKLLKYAGLAKAGTPLISATVFVGGNVWVGKGAVFLLGCSPNITCAEGITNDQIGGDLIAVGALGVVVHSTQIGGNVSLYGGGDGLSGLAACTADPAPWSADNTLTLAHLPVYSDVEDNTIGGNLTIDGLQSCWLGAFNNQVQGSFWFNNNTMGDPDANEVAENLVQGNMGCFGNEPGTPPPGTAMSTGVQFGDSGAAPSIVGGWAFGQCGFKVTSLNPAPQAGPGGIPEHLTVSAWHLHRYEGLHTEVSNFASATLATTSTGDTLLGELNNAALSGSGLVGSVAIDSSKAYDGSGENVFETTYPSHWSSFEANDLCTCTFQGQSGSVEIRAYGTTSPSGVTNGTFIINSGGAQGGGLGTLAGWGTFSSWGQAPGTLGLTEYLAIT